MMVLTILSALNAGLAVWHYAHGKFGIAAVCVFAAALGALAARCGMTQ